jgi:hypothetical protein
MLRWYGQQDAGWIASYDCFRRLGRCSFDEADARQLDLWATLARSSGWWWPADRVCVVAERPAALHTEPGELPRLHHPSRHAVRFADGRGAYVWHGTPVPAWVFEDPDVERIALESNVEIRRCAIERMGWEVYIGQSGLRLIGSAPDPGNPDSELQLYDTLPFTRARPSRLLLAVNGSVERDGHRRRYGLSVPATVDDPIAAAGWSYGLSAAQYATLVRRT